jgi:hypothetical protein
VSTVKLLSQAIWVRGTRGFLRRSAALAGITVLSATQLLAQGYPDRGPQGYSDRGPQGYSDRAPQGYSDRAAPGYANNSPRCQDLERQLVSDWQRSSSPQEALARIDQQLEPLQRQRRAAESEAERRNCYEDLFIFGRSLRRTRECVQLDSDIEGFRRQISNLRQQREGLTNSAARRGRREDLVAELARAGCGENYRQEYESRRRSSSIFSFWQDEDTSFDRGYANTPPGTQSNLPFASYRTMCVRLCDGYYFPISFSTVGSRFAEDETKCKDQCAAPAELFVYKNPGEEVEQMVSTRGEPYISLKNAFRHRKQYIKGCSCKQAEYSPHQIELSEQELRKQANASGPSSSRPSAAKSAQGAGDVGPSGIPQQPQDQTAAKATGGNQPR